MRHIFSASCVLCDSSIPIAKEKGSLCKHCQEDLPWLQFACDFCGIALNEELDKKDGLKVCGACQSSPPPVDYTLSALHYSSPVDYLVSELKFKQKLTVATILSAVLSKRIEYAQEFNSRSFPDLIIPVPLHKKRLIKRGFNQALEIAKPIAKQFSIPLQTNLIIRIKDTAPQSELNASQRNKNIRNSFFLEDISMLQGRSHIVLLDDVVTTGATCNELASLLKENGVKTVGVWSVARA